MPLKHPPHPARCIHSCGVLEALLVSIIVAFSGQHARLAPSYAHICVAMPGVRVLKRRHRCSCFAELAVMAHAPAMIRAGQRHRVSGIMHFENDTRS